MKLILDPEVKEFLKKNNTITKQDLINKMHELFPKYPDKYTLICSNVIKADKTYQIFYGTNINNVDIDCIDITEKTDDKRTIKEICSQKTRKQNKQPV